LSDPFLRHLGLARRAGKLALGQDRLFAALKRQDVFLIVASDDIGSAAGRQLYARAAKKKITVISGYDREMLGRAVGVDRCTVIGVLERGFAETLQKKCQPSDG
jgi:ribosomal protein L7Ae-like RNA K-turn-binding protein